jgi:RNA polymerase sigma-70 factor, ECF subfamily
MADETRQERFEAVFRAHVAAVRRYVARRTEDGVEDVVAETFTTAWRRLEAVPVDAGPWLLATARRVLANQRRATRRREALSERLTAQVPGVVLHEPDDPRAEAVFAALARLGERDRELLLLVERDGMSRDDAATVLGISRAQVRVRLHRARRRFAARYAELAPAGQTIAIREGVSHAAR